MRLVIVCYKRYQPQHNLPCEKIDCVGRTGGEEFMVVLPDSALDSAVEIAQRLCDCIAAINIKNLKIIDGYYQLRCCPTQ